MSFISQAYSDVCREASDADGVCVSLYRKDSYYGGPEEGGWYGTDYILLRHQRFATLELAEKVAAQVQLRAAELTAEAKRLWSERCSAELDWCEARGLEADYLPEPDGPSEYEVIVEPFAGRCASTGPRHYE
jgi:hypothetical protein